MQLEFNKKSRDNVEATRAGGSIKKDNCSLLKLSKIGKLEKLASLPLIDKFTLLLLRDNIVELANAYSMNMRLVKFSKHF